MIVFRITFDLYLHWPNHSAPRGVRKRQVEGAVPRGGQPSLKNAFVLMERPSHSLFR